MRTRAMPLRRGPGALLALAVVLGATAAAPAAGAAGGGAGPAEEQFTPVVMRVMSPPRWFTGTDDRVHLVYELEITNGFPVPVTATSLTVRDVPAGDALAELTGEELTASMSLLSTPTEPQTELAPSSVAVVWLDLPFDRTSDLPARVEHELTVSVPPGLPVPPEITDVGARTRVDRAPPIALSPPLEGPGWLAVGGCCDGPHRRSVQPIDGELWLSQRFAIDFNRLSEDDLLATGDPSRNQSWPTYDQPVLAVADATVVQAVDGFADQVPNAPAPVTIAEADGNYVILKVADGVYAFYAHLAPGSVRVQPGDTVRAGDVIGRTGNSGSSTGPHLHFHVMDRPSALRSNGLPYVFDRFTLTGRTPPLDVLMQSNPETDPVPVDTADAGRRRDELPQGRDVVAFAAAGSTSSSTPKFSAR